MGEFDIGMIAQAVLGANLGKALGDDALIISASGSAAAAGEDASASIRLVASVESRGSETVADVSVTAEAEASDGGGASASAMTDAEAFGAGLMVTEEHVDTETDGESPSAFSFTHLRAVRSDFDEFETRDFPNDGSLGDWLSDLNWWT